MGSRKRRGTVKGCDDPCTVRESYEERARHILNFTIRPLRLPRRRGRFRREGSAEARRRFILENWVLDRWVRYILTVYPVVIVALVGNILRHFNPDDPTPNSVFMVVLLVLACVLLVSRICTVIWRNYWRPLLSPGSARLMVSPLDGRKFRVFS